ncbi:MAG: aconitase B, partial [Myxococcota bacterium]
MRTRFEIGGGLVSVDLAQKSESLTATLTSEDESTTTLQLERLPSPAGSIVLRAPDGTIHRFWVSGDEVTWRGGRATLPPMTGRRSAAASS